MASVKKNTKVLNDSVRVTPATTGSTALIACWSVGSLNNDTTDERN